MSITGDRVTKDAEELIDSLKRRLDRARFTVISFLPFEVLDLLLSYMRCESREEACGWQGQIIEVIIEQAESPAFRVPARGGLRAVCPLCSDAHPWPDDEGYAMPEGLRRHLAGKGNVSQCAVMEIVAGMAEEDWDERFSAADQAAAQARAERRKTETLYLVSPDREPKLLEEDLLAGRPRSPGELAWAENRLKALGFRPVREGRTLRWIDERDDYVVYADHRTHGRISFEVWRKPLPRNRSPRGQLLSHALGVFHFLDTWKQDLPGKYAERVAKALKG